MSTHPPGEKPEKLPDEDTRAILDRRRFLIESTLAGAGIGIAASGCRPQVCLSVEPEPGPCLSPPPEDAVPGPTDEPEVCLDLVPPEPPPPPGEPEPYTCLSPTPPTVEPVPEVCLSVPLHPPRSEPRFEICLSPRRD